MGKYRINGYTFEAEQRVNGVLINPKLPKGFDSTPNEARTASHQKWWNRPYIETMSADDWETFYKSCDDEYAEKRWRDWEAGGRQKWFDAWPTGVRYDVRCLDGGAWDRSTCWGMFASLEEALVCASVGGRPTRI